MDWQQVSALAVVAVTAIWMAWHVLRPTRPGFTKRRGCGCAGAAGPPRETLVFHARKGHPPEVHVRAVATPRRPVARRPAPQPGLESREEVH
jgi:ABC-type nickel/cobalt efflux system permease component RcnA